MTPSPWLGSSDDSLDQVMCLPPWLGAICLPSNDSSTLVGIKGRRLLGVSYLEGSHVRVVEGVRPVRVLVLGERDGPCPRVLRILNQLLEPTFIF